MEQARHSIHPRVGQVVLHSLSLFLHFSAFVHLSTNHFLQLTPRSAGAYIIAKETSDKPANSKRGWCVSEGAAVARA